MPLYTNYPQCFQTAIHVCTNICESFQLDILVKLNIGVIHLFVNPFLFLSSVSSNFIVGFGLVLCAFTLGLHEYFFQHVHLCTYTFAIYIVSITAHINTYSLVNHLSLFIIPIHVSLFSFPLMNSVYKMSNTLVLDNWLPLISKYKH